MKAIKLVVRLVLIVGVIVAGWFFYQATLAPTKYEDRLEFSTLPADDAALLAWLRTQPGVSEAKVEREGSEVVLHYAIKGEAPVPEVIPQCEHLGYQDLVKVTQRSESRRR